MIVKKMPPPPYSDGFGALQRYLQFEDNGKVRKDVIASWAQGVASCASAAAEMQAIASYHCYNGKDPAYHIVLSSRPGEMLDIETVRGACNLLVESLGAEDRQALFVCHRDNGEGGDALLARIHVHIMINLIHPVTGRRLDLIHDFAKMARACEAIEIKFGLQRDYHARWRDILKPPDRGTFSTRNTTLYQNPNIGQATSRSLNAEGGSTASRDARRRRHYSWSEQMNRTVLPVLEAAVRAPAAQWKDVHNALHSCGVAIVPGKCGYRIVGAAPGQHVKLSTLGLRASELDNRLGPYMPSSAPQRFHARIQACAAVASQWRSWTEANTAMAEEGIAVRKIGPGRGRILDLLGCERAKVAALGESLAELERRLGPWSISQQLRERDDLEAERAESGINKDAARIASNPSLVLSWLGELRPVWDRHDVERVLRLKLGVGPHRAPKAIANATAAILASCVHLGDGMYTTAEISDNERVMFKAAAELSKCNMEHALRNPQSSQNFRDCIAFDYLASTSQLTIIVSHSGAEIRQLLANFVRACVAADMRVFGICVASVAMREVPKDAGIQRATLAKVVDDLNQGKIKLQRNDVFLVVDAHLLRPSQTRALLDHAVKTHSTVRLIGSLPPNDVPVIGAVFRELAVLHNCMHLMPRNVRRAIDNAHDLLSDLPVPQPSLVGKSFATHADALTHIAKQYCSGGPALITTNHIDNGEVNRCVQRRLANNGSTGDERVYPSCYQIGGLPFRIGDRVAIHQRKPCKNGPWVAGDFATVLEHRPDAMYLCRERDGAIDLWNVRKYSAIDLGYSTVSSAPLNVASGYAWVLAGEPWNGSYRGVARNYQHVIVGYGRDRVHNINDLVNDAERAAMKVLVRRAQMRCALVKRSLKSMPQRRNIDRRLDNEVNTQGNASLAIDDGEEASQIYMLPDSGVIEM